LATGLGAHLELPLLQALVPNAVAGRLKVQHLHLGFAPINEDKTLPTQRVLLHLVLNQRTQAVEGLAYVGGLSAQPEYGLTARDEHQY